MPRSCLRKKTKKKQGVIAKVLFGPSCCICPLGQLSLQVAMFVIILCVCLCVPDLQKSIFCELWNFGKAHLAGKKRVNYDKFEIATNCVNQIFNLNAFFFFLLTGATWYYHTIYLVSIYFASFIDYENEIFEVISNLHVQGSKFGGKMNKFGGVCFFKVWCVPSEEVFLRSSSRILWRQ